MRVVVLLPFYRFNPPFSVRLFPRFKLFVSNGLIQHHLVNHLVILAESQVPGLKVPPCPRPVVTLLAEPVQGLALFMDLKSGRV